MKKLLITTMAAVSVGLCAKAEDYDGTKTSFEEDNYEAGQPLLINNENSVWKTLAIDGLFVISNLTDFANQTKASRPDYWATQSGDSKALTIDTDAPLFCDVNVRNTPYTFSDGPIFFDSVVQFTATDVAAKPDSADKLRVWLYTSPDDVSETNLGLFKETSRKTCLVVTAGKYDGELSSSNLNAEHYEVQIEGVEIQPDTWHRLTIKAIADIDPRADFYTPAFEIWVDGKPVTYGADKKTQFPSLKRGEVNETLQCVAFDGKGAVDDIVFTTTDPLAAPSYKVTVTMEDGEKDALNEPKQYSVDGGKTYVDLDQAKAYGDGDVLAIPQTATKILFKIAIPNDEKKLEGVDASAGEYEGGGYYWIKEVNVADIISNGEGEVVLKVVDNTSTPEVTTYKVTVNSADATVEGIAEKYAADTVVTFAVKANPGYEVVSVMMNTTPLSVNDEGKYSFTMPAEAVTITVTTNAATPTVEPGKQIECDSEEAANEVAKKVTITVTDKDAAAAGQAAVIKAVVKQNGNKWVVTAEIDTKAAAYISADDTLVKVAQKLTDIANATEVDEDGNVTVALSEVTPGLYYSVDVSENLAGENQGFNPGTRTLATSAGQVTLKVSKPNGNSAFFKVVQHLTKE